MIVNTSQSLSHSRHQRRWPKDERALISIVQYTLASGNGHLWGETSQSPKRLNSPVEHESAYNHNRRWFGRRLATDSGLPRAPIIKSAGEPNLGASFDRESSATGSTRTVSAKLSAYTHSPRHAVKCAEAPPTHIVSWQS